MTDLELSTLSARLSQMLDDLEIVLREAKENPAAREEIERNTRHSGRPGERVTGEKEAEKNTRGLLGRQEKEPHKQRNLDVKPSRE